MTGTKNNTLSLSQLLKRNYSFMLPYLLFLIGGAILQFIASKREIFLYVNQHYSSAADLFFMFYTHVGDGLFCVIIIIGLLFIRYGWALAAAASFLLSSGLSILLKRVIFPGHYRPKKYFETEPGLLRFIEGLEVHTANSFPSGHTITAFAIFSILTILMRNKAWGYIWFLLALFAGFSRIYLAQHFFEDVYWGSIVGVVSTIIIWLLLTQRWELHQKYWWDKSLRNHKLF